MRKLLIGLILSAVLITPIAPLITAKIIQKYAGIVMLLNPNNAGGGTGFHVTRNNKTYILTNAHVCGLAEPEHGYDKETKEPIGDLYITVADKWKTYKKKVIKFSRKHDLCLVEPIYDSGISRFSKPMFAMPVIAAGFGRLNPLTSSIGFFRNSHLLLVCTQGSFFGCTRVSRFETDVYTTVIFGGHSGSPIISPLGELVGVVFAGNPSTGTTAAVPIKYVEEFLDSIN
jgi:S1-C subfamily serine protease